LISFCEEIALGYNCQLTSFQSNHEGELIDFIQANTEDADGIIINPGAFGHYSYALHDALLDAQLPCVEVHLSNVEEREDWRKKSVLTDICIAKISGKKEEGYREAIEILSVDLNLVIGFPLEHSLSPELHNQMYKKLEIATRMLALESQNLCSLIKRIHHSKIGLTAVTMPHKENIIPYLDHVDELAKDIGSVNTVINNDGELFGYNTDHAGIEYALRDEELSDKQVLILGAGGAAKTVAYYLNKMNAKVLYFNRTKEKADTLAEIYGGRVISKNDLDRNKVDFIINTTPLGMSPFENQSPLSLDEMPEGTTVFDLIYNPNKTLLMQYAEQKGGKSISGIDMFVAQALKQIELWKGLKLDTEIYLNELNVN
jgi:shikimate dehydrogenase